MLKKKMTQIITRIKHTSTMNVPFCLKQINIKNENTKDISKLMCNGCLYIVLYSMFYQLYCTQTRLKEGRQHTYRSHHKGRSHTPLTICTCHFKRSMVRSESHMKFSGACFPQSCSFGYAYCLGGGHSRVV